MRTSEFDVDSPLKKLTLIESMLREIKQELSFLDKDFRESVRKGEEDIARNKVTTCKTEEELDNFFSSI